MNFHSTFYQIKNTLYYMLCKMEAKSYLKCEDASLSKKIIYKK